MRLKILSYFICSFSFVLVVQYVNIPPLPPCLLLDAMPPLRGESSVTCKTEYTLPSVSCLGYDV